MRRHFVAIALVVALTGCGTIIKGGRQDVVVTSATRDTEVIILSPKGEAYRGPPGKVTLARENAYTVKASAPGHKQRTVSISRSISGWMFGNVIWVLPIFWGVGIALDAASGGLWSLAPDDLDVTMVPDLSPPAVPVAAPVPLSTAAPPPTTPPASVPDAGSGDFGY